MKNILLKSLYKIHNQSDLPAPSRGMTSKKSFECYQEMQKLSIESFKINMAGNWSLVQLGGSFDNLPQAFKYTLHKTRQIHRDNYPCNILYVDPDVLCLEPIDPWCDTKNIDFHLFGENNCGVRYFKHTMSNKLWQSILSQAKNWDNNNYAFEQDLYIMLEKEAIKLAGKKLEDYVSACDLWNQIHQEPNFQSRDENLNEHEINLLVESMQYLYEHSLVHFHSSRIPCATLSLMKKTWHHCENNIS